MVTTCLVQLPRLPPAVFLLRLTAAAFAWTAISSSSSSTYLLHMSIGIMCFSSVPCVGHATAQLNAEREVNGFQRRASRPLLVSIYPSFTISVFLSWADLP
ncbi:hypothetical protein BDN70DRAFT_602318 [Pholiota conissans]|uniref:Uncharacterized protein n=1 Tax=Pholiota conissans TaxID=109636 RepID=A0A9P5YL62_9AGAR|nr:hypothetical protein BDN70DRAFT_602318 [Pholiota conissans]